MKKFPSILAIIYLLLIPCGTLFAGAGGIVQKGVITIGHVATWAGNNVIQDGGVAGLPYLAVNPNTTTATATGTPSISLGGDTAIGNFDIAIGFNLPVCTSSSGGNIFIGNSAGGSCTSASNNISLGETTFRASSQGDILIGAATLNTTSLLNSIVIGNTASSNVSDSIALGLAASVSSTTLLDFEVSSGHIQIDNNGVTHSSTGFQSDDSTRQVAGTIINDNAQSGWIGEDRQSILPVGSGVSLSSTITSSLTSISLTPGDWDVFGEACTQPAGTTTTSEIVSGFSTTGALPTAPYGIAGLSGLTNNAGRGQCLPVPTIRVSIASNTTYFLVVNSTFAVSTDVGYGYIEARRVR